MAIRLLILVGLLARAALAAPPNLAAQGVTSCPDAPNVPTFQATGFPPADGSVANIVQGDTVAQALYQQILANATYADALAIRPSTVNNGNPSFNGYNSAQDPACWWTASTCTASKRPYLAPDFSACNEARTWGLTIDDGPLPAHCALYQLLAQNSITASLFYIGSNVVSNPGSALEGFKAGHVICVHTWSHHYTTSLTNAQVFAELYYTKLAIKRVTGYTPRCFRPPYGDVDDRVRTIAMALELNVWLWDQDTNDWSADSGASAASINQNYNAIIQAAGSGQGVITLTHELSLQVTSFFINNFAALSQAYSTAVVSAHICSNITHPYAEPNAPIWPSFQHYLAGARPNNGQPLVPITNSSAAIYMAGIGAAQTGPDFIDLASMSSASAAAAATAKPSSASVALSSSAAIGANGNAIAANSLSASSNLPLSTPAKIGIIAGSLVGGAILLVLVAFVLLRRRRSKPQERSSVYAPSNRQSLGPQYYTQDASTSEFSLYKPPASTSELSLHKPPRLSYAHPAVYSTDSFDEHLAEPGVSHDGPPSAARGAYYRPQ